MSKNDTKSKLLNVGTQLVLEGGYNHTGLNEVLETAGVPKGSFYYYFSSKEDFGLQLIDSFAASNRASLQRFLNDASLDPLARLKAYFRYNVEYLTSLEFRRGCLIGNMSQELSDQNETFRLRLEEVTQEWAAQIADCLKQAQVEGQINAAYNSDELAEFCLNSWQGAILAMKSAKCAEPLENFMRLMFEVVLTK